MGSPMRNQCIALRRIMHDCSPCESPSIGRLQETGASARLQRRSLTGFRPTFSSTYVMYQHDAAAVATSILLSYENGREGQNLRSSWRCSLQARLRACSSCRTCKWQDLSQPRHHRKSSNTFLVRVHPNILPNHLLWLTGRIHAPHLHLRHVCNSDITDLLLPLRVRVLSVNFHSVQALRWQPILYPDPVAVE